MNIIPVIDLMDGQAVHARQGERRSYRPVHSALSASSAPLDVVAALMELYPFTRLYIADINAIERRGQHTDTIRAIRATHPALELWLDCGVRRAVDVSDWQRRGVHCVIGSESVADLAGYLELREAAGDSGLLSLDFDRDDAFRGPPELLQEAALWPERVIVMTLARVGSLQGPDLSRLDALRGRGVRQRYAAGGVRQAADLRLLADAGVDGVLVASALHSGALTAADLAACADAGPRH